MTKAQAGRIGGKTTAARHPGHHETAGRKGGQQTANKGPWHFAGIGAAGGTATRNRRGAAWFGGLKGAL